MIAGLVLAAGASRRFGSTKQLLPLGGRALIDWPLDALRQNRMSQLVLVLGHDAAEIQRTANLSGIDVVLNPDYAQGMSTSLQCGLATLRAEISSVLVITCDQPLVSGAHLEKILDTGASGDYPIVATDYGDYSGVPMLLARSVWPMAETIQGDQGARVLLRLRPDLASYVSSEDPAMSLDVDTPEQYEALLRILAERA